MSAAAEDLAEIESYLYARAAEIKAMVQDGTPWIFLCAASFLDLLTRLANGGRGGRTQYKSFIRTYLSRVNPLYIDFQYASGERDLPEQMYHVLRCGIVHAFSLVPDEKSRDEGGRSRSIVLSHRANNDGPHLSVFKRIAPRPFDAALFNAEDFADDIERVIHLLFHEARSKPELAEHIIAAYLQLPPIVGDIETRPAK